MKRQSEQTIAYRVYLNGTNDLLGVATVDMPEIKNMTETISGTGIAGEYESPTIGQFSSMTVKLAWNSLSNDFFDLLNPYVPMQLDCRASIQEADPLTGAKSNVPLALTIWGTTKGSPTGTLETGKKHGNETEIEVIRVRLELDGKEKILIDKANMIYAVNGIDMLMAVRSDLGLAF